MPQSTKSPDERIAELDKRVNQLEARKQDLRARAAQDARKKRTRELIQIGGIMARMGIDTLEKAQAFQELGESDKFLRAALVKAAGTQLD
jgi:hypothetical protein